MLSKLELVDKAIALSSAEEDVRRLRRELKHEIMSNPDYAPYVSIDWTGLKRDANMGGLKC